MSLFPDFNWRKPVAVIAVVSAVGLGLTMTSEGEVNTAYKDAGNGTLTIGYGHTGKDVKVGQTITHERAVQLLKQDMNFAEKAVIRNVKVPLYQHEFDAYADFIYNVGEGNFKKSNLLKKLNQGRYAEACGELKKWVYAGGKKLNGLVKRREAEYKMCMGIK